MEKSRRIAPLTGGNPRPQGLKLNVGCGSQYMDGWVNVDSNPHVRADQYFDIGRDPWPFASNSVAEIVAAHVLEHLTTDQLFHAMREIYRVCVNDAHVGIILPHPRHRVYLNDPTHQHPLTLDTFGLFSQDAQRKMWVQHGKTNTAMWQHLEVDFSYEGQAQFVLDPDIPDEWRDNWKYYECYYNNVVVEVRFTIKPVKPFDPQPLPERKVLADAAGDPDGTA